MSGHQESNFNKIAKGVLFAGILAMISGFIADGLYQPKMPTKTAFAIDVPEAGAAGEPAAAAAPEVDINELMKTADATRGEALAAKKCSSCHSFEAGGANKVGPNLHGAFGKPAGHHAGYPYSSALTAANPTWTYENLNHWLKNPQAVAKGAKMTLKTAKDAERADIIKYLESIK